MDFPHYRGHAEKLFMLSDLEVCQRRAHIVDGGRSVAEISRSLGIHKNLASPLETKVDCEVARI